ncbi:monovalent cation/H+ antiporter subunit A [Rhodoplanes sp. TEM]|uniref:Monovalent cation/H+ antiporter subunit A n=1 Tax=Rhodoplanes tepidamans TaxID=200616 RepID=A0ABT5JIL1_RHOTP|nr:MULTISPECIES: monovalent cation/H+ antiporter subunit A [Rhodoplanes]MDC7789538.1 monovalent cation/H+ antiporter subunit A [Rhodoplanes tepidamans]MDC7987835.1 monovalent cation/H+ antiporter subunit A [Rhodoplanes sp. TEM]MDQ0353998.1 multicomponent K+:H+ antiporter subunit A [Rhodoplanes tepidamans]
MRLALIALLPLLGAMLPPLASRAGRDAVTAVAALVTLTALALLATSAPAVLRGEIVQDGTAWVPQLGLSFSFFLDGLGLFFAALILVIGLLVIVYARSYLGRDEPVGRFFAYLLLFQGAMLGIVISDNVLLLVVFWELTSLSSFLLIGWWHQAPEGRQGARMALVVTGGGGLLLMAGMLLLGHAAGSYELSEILLRGDVVRASPLYLPILLLVLGGAFTKSAQVPFHFWLPHAMAAPTPVSTYLHSATMVKAGVFLLARLWPVLAGTEAWFLIVTATGLVTMLVGAWIALFKTDLKAILAYSTVSHLGLMTMLLGFGTPIAAVACVFHVLNHATFKAALFMGAGIVDHETGTRDIRRLGGLAGLMPITATLTLIAAAAMAGVPLFNGFLSKEMMLEAAWHTRYADLAWPVPLLATLAALLSVAYSARYAIGVFLGRPRAALAHHPHDPPAGMWLPVAVLLVPVLLIGVAPALFAGDVVALAGQATIGTAALPGYHLALWHGVTPALIMSVAAFAGAALLYAGLGPLTRLHARLDRPDAKAAFDAVVAAVVRACRTTTRRLHTESLPRYLAIITGVVVLVGAAGFFGGTHAAGGRATLPVSLPAVVAFVLLATTSLAVPAVHGMRLLTLVLVSVVGLVVSLAFLQFSAPDLALTQITVEVVATILLLLALNLLPKRTPSETGTARTAGAAPTVRMLRDGAIAGAAGLGVAALAYAVMTRDFTPISDYHLAQSKPGGGGTNVVNVILVDFRGFDTFGEIIVLSIAALAIVALLDNALRGAAARRLDTLKRAVEAADPHPTVLVVVARALLPLALTVGIYIFFRGHNLPGGGFIAGLVVAIALMMQYMAAGFDWTAARRRFDAHALIGAGVLVAGLTGLGALAFGRPFLTSSYGYFHVPLIGEIELATAMLFDTGVFLAVVGTVVLSLARISLVERRAERGPPSRSAAVPGPDRATASRPAAAAAPVGREA